MASCAAPQSLPRFVTCLSSVRGSVFRATFRTESSSFPRSLCSSGCDGYFSYQGNPRRDVSISQSWLEKVFEIQVWWPLEQKTTDWISYGQSIDESLAAGASRWNRLSLDSQNLSTRTDWWIWSKKSACEPGHGSTTPPPKNVTTPGTRSCWKKWTKETSKSRCKLCTGTARRVRGRSDLQRAPVEDCFAAGECRSAGDAMLIVSPASLFSVELLLRFVGRSRQNLSPKAEDCVLLFPAARKLTAGACSSILLCRQIMLSENSQPQRDGQSYFRSRPSPFQGIIMHQFRVTTQTDCRRSFSRRLRRRITAFVISSVALIILEMPCTKAVSAESTTRPNVVYIMADELGYFELSCL